jgi:hypothetical protein
MTHMKRKKLLMYNFEVLDVLFECLRLNLYLGRQSRRPRQKYIAIFDLGKYSHLTFGFFVKFFLLQSCLCFLFK